MGIELVCKHFELRWALKQTKPHGKLTTFTGTSFRNTVLGTLLVTTLFGKPSSSEHSLESAGTHGAPASMGHRQAWGPGKHGAPASMGRRQAWGAGKHGAPASMGPRQAWGPGKHGALASMGPRQA